MENRKTQATELSSYEIVFNLWAYAGEDGSILRLAVKPYVMQGDDTEKLALLRELSSTDFLSVSWEKVPANFKSTNPNGEVMHGVANASMLSDPNTHGVLFGKLLDRQEDALPEHLRSINGDYVRFRLEMPEAPLCVTTIVVEYEDGRLVPMVSR